MASTSRVRHQTKRELDYIREHENEMQIARWLVWPKKFWKEQYLYHMDKRLENMFIIACVRTPFKAGKILALWKRVHERIKTL